MIFDILQLVGLIVTVIVIFRKFHQKNEIIAGIIVYGGLIVFTIGVISLIPIIQSAPTITELDVISSQELETMDNGDYLVVSFNSIGTFSNAYAVKMNGNIVSLNERLTIILPIDRTNYAKPTLSNCKIRPNLWRSYILSPFASPDYKLLIIPTNKITYEF